MQVTESDCERMVIEFKSTLAGLDSGTFIGLALCGSVPPGAQDLYLKLLKEFKEVDGEEEEGEEAEDEEGDPDLIFKVKLDKPEPQGVKISKKNVCLVTLLRNDEEDKMAKSQRKMIEFYL